LARLSNRPESAGKEVLDPVAPGDHVLDEELEIWEGCPEEGVAAVEALNVAALVGEMIVGDETESDERRQAVQVSGVEDLHAAPAQRLVGVRKLWMRDLPAR
jgi:hypothetical protein